MGRSALRVVVLAAVGVLAAPTCSSSKSCVVGGKTHQVGEAFPSDDGCNTCSCGADGAVACTTRACVDGGASGQAGTSGTGAAGTGAAGTGAAGSGAAGTGTAGTGSAGTGTAGTGSAGRTGAGGQGGAAGGGCAFTAVYTFRDDGGFRIYSDESTLMPARTHMIDRVSVGADGRASCAHLVPCTSPQAVVTVPAIEAAVANADVQAALAKPPGMLYGTDSRPFDGTVWVFERLGKSFMVGGGNAVPAGLRALETLLHKLTGETLAAPECAALRP